MILCQVKKCGNILFTNGTSLPHFDKVLFKNCCQSRVLTRSYLANLYGFLISDSFSVIISRNA